MASLSLGADPNLGADAAGNIGVVQGRYLIPNSGRSLRSAPFGNNLDSFDLLLAAGADPTNKQLMHAAVAGGHISAVELVLVLALGATVEDTDDIIQMGYPAYKSPVARAVKTGEVEMVDFLIRRGADVRRAGYDGYSALDVVRGVCCVKFTLKGWCRDGLHRLPGEDIIKCVEEAAEKQGKEPEESLQEG